MANLETQPGPPSFEDQVAGLRADIEILGKKVRELVGTRSVAIKGEKEVRGEVLANLMISFRSLEDARMRLGKVFQAMDGGVSAYDK